MAVQPPCICPSLLCCQPAKSIAPSPADARPLQLKGYAAASNVRGTVFLETIGIDAADLTTDIIVNNCYYLGLVRAQGGGGTSGRAVQHVGAVHHRSWRPEGMPGAAAGCPWLADGAPRPSGPLPHGLCLGLQALLAFVLLYAVMPRPRWSRTAAGKP